ncbi:MAG: alpha-D-ribose 1-methylphosphonate 5-triphosphate diphosphatase [Glutamicibacter sp.]|uniref:alpha-D-ribose 1-methylphosphonate 5-triphosphate diphosphatase n=1 Tax=Glutamicibacter sp. TaxID=1931995 RepID=UPI002FC9F6EC
MVESYTLGHVRLLSGHGVLDDQLISVVNGRIEEIRDHRSGLGADIDGRGQLCLPGIVDLHSDALSREYRPRPGARLPVDIAMQAAEGNLLAAGVTTAFHAVSFQAKSPVGLPIGSPNAPEIHEAISGYANPRMDHRVLHRLDVRCREGVGMLRRVLEPDQVPLVSYEDHTPGQGQYRDRTVMERWLREAQHMDPQRAAAHVDQLVAERDQQLPFKEETLAWLGEAAGDGEIRLMGHDPVTPAEIDALVARNAVIAEFPTTLEAAVHATQQGIATVAGAPNILLGKSHSGNVAAIDLAQAGALGILASDYLPSSMLMATYALAQTGLLAPFDAMRLISENPARAAGLDDRGVVAAGYRADLVLCAEVNERPRVMRTLSAQ